MAAKRESEIVLLGAGDIGPERAEPVTIFRHVKKTFKSSDAAFVQLEVNLSKRPGPGELPRHRAADTARASCDESCLLGEIDGNQGDRDTNGVSSLTFQVSGFRRPS